MALVACGINHHQAPLALRERLIFPFQSISEPLTSLIRTGRVKEVAILPTCYRTEIYCDTEYSEDLIPWLHQWHSLSPSEMDPYLYLFKEEVAVKHLFRVASGLDSKILGEPQILGQVKTAFSAACEAGTVGKLLHRLFQHAFSVTKQVRSDTAIGAQPVSVAYASVNLAKRIFEKLSSLKVLLVGAGETIELMASHLREQNVAEMFIANRTFIRAETLARKFNAVPLRMEEMLSHLADVDMVVTATTSSLPLLGKGSVETALKLRRHRPMLMIDLAVPRDIEPEVGQLSDVYLYTVDDLSDVIEENLKSRQHAALEAEKIIDYHTAHFMRSLQSLEAVPTICRYRERLETLRQEELVKALRELQQGKPADEVLKEFSRLLMNKLTHAPSQKMQLAAYEGQDEILELARYLFDLPL